MSGSLASEMPPQYVLRLYITGNTARSLKAIANLQAILAAQLDDEYDLQIIDIYQQPEAAAQHQIIAAPTLVRLSPAPVRRIIGDLSDNERVMRGLDMIPRNAEAGDAQPFGA